MTDFVISETRHALRAPGSNEGRQNAVTGVPEVEAILEVE
jgi:hypothetical protein